MAEITGEIDGVPVETSGLDVEAVRARANAAMNDDAPGEQAPPKVIRGEVIPEDKPKAKRGRPPKSEQARTTAPPPPEATPEITAKRAQSASENLQIIGGALTMLGKSVKSTAFKADGYTIEHIAPKLGEATAEVAKYEPGLARWMDSSGGGGKVTAYMALFACFATLGAQLAVNHKVLKPGLMGSVTPEQIIDDHFEPPEKPADAETAPDTA